MRIHLDRSRLFALLGALEEDLRSLIEIFLIPTRYEHQVLGPAYEKAVERFAKDEAREIAETTVLDYLDLGDEIEILNRWRADLPAQTRESLMALSGRLAELVPIRNRVVHRRPLLADDFEKAQRVLMQLQTEGFEGSALSDALHHLRDDPGWSPPGPSGSSGGRTLNNLPLGDYDETGLVGRRREHDKLYQQVAALNSSRSPVLTVVGPGGVGKTALVLQVLHDIVNDEECPYDLVSWVSLKTEQLTARGVQLIRDAVFSVEQAMPALGEVLDSTFEGTSAQLADSLDGLTTLIVIDNLETVSGREVVDLVDTLPETVSYLFTSREGLGELERRFPLAPLEERHAVDLLRRLARARGLEAYARMEQAVAEDLVRQLGASPLGLKWFVSSVELGRDPNEVVRHREELVRFCVENVFDSLDDDARAVATVLHVLARPVTAQEVHLYMPDMPGDRLRSSIQSLDQRMLVRRDLVVGSMYETFEASEPLSEHLRFGELVDPDEARRLGEVDDEYRRAEERHRIDAASDPLRPNIIQGGPEHRASVLLLRNALSQSKRGQVEDALELVLEAEDLDPEFWEIHRVRGFILSSSGPVEEATAAYMKAIDLAPNPEMTAVVKYFFAGHLTRRASDSVSAAQIAREAHEVLASPRTAIEFGRALTYIEEFKSAEVLLKEGLEADDIRTRLIALTQLVDCMKRRAETEASVERQPDKAVATLVEAIEIADSALKKGLVDRTLVDKAVSLGSEILKLAVSCQEDEATRDALLRSLEVVDRLGDDARRCRSFGYLVGHARRLVSQRPELTAAAAGVMSDVTGFSSTSASSLDSDRDEYPLIGSIKAWKPDRHFGFVTTLDRQEDFFFNRAALISPADEILLQRGTRVRFFRDTGPDGRPEARDVSVDEVDDSVLSCRRLIVNRRHSGGSYLFSTDLKSGATVFVGRHAMRDVTEWNEIEIGLELDSPVEIDAEGRFNAKTKSVRIAR